MAAIGSTIGSRLICQSPAKTAATIHAAVRKKMRHSKVASHQVSTVPYGETASGITQSKPQNTTVLSILANGLMIRESKAPRGLSPEFFATDNFSLRNRRSISGWTFYKNSWQFKTRHAPPTKCLPTLSCRRASLIELRELVRSRIVEVQLHSPH